MLGAWPMLRRDINGDRHFYALNLAVVAVALMLITLTWGALAEEIYRCDIQGIPNCD